MEIAEIQKFTEVDKTKSITTQRRKIIQLSQVKLNISVNFHTCAISVIQLVFFLHFCNSISFGILVWFYASNGHNAQHLSCATDFMMIFSIGNCCPILFTLFVIELYCASTSSTGTSKFDQEMLQHSQ